MFLLIMLLARIDHGWKNFNDTFMKMLIISNLIMYN